MNTRLSHLLIDSSAESERESSFHIVRGWEEHFLVAVEGLPSHECGEIEGYIELGVVRVDGVFVTLV
jgi:hypothetical protein